MISPSSKDLIRRIQHNTAYHTHYTDARTYAYSCYYFNIIVRTIANIMIIHLSGDDNKTRQCAYDMYYNMYYRTSSRISISRRVLLLQVLLSNGRAL